MIVSLAEKYRKRIAAFFIVVFYLELLLPYSAFGKSTTPERRYFAQKPEIDIKGWQHKLGQRKAFQFDAIAVTANEDTLSVERKDDLDNDKKTLQHKPNSLKIGGPGQPEMSSFQSVNGNNMVDLFSGDFSYNIPLMDVGGYPINIHYNSGITMDQEASWVGLGWNINPGTVTRNMRGLPDDFNGKDSIVKTQHIKTNRTIGVKVAVQPEMVGLPLKITAGAGVFHNNYKGWGIEQSLNAAISVGVKSKGAMTSDDDSSSSSIGANLGLGLNNNSQTGLSVSPSMNVQLQKFDKDVLTSTSNFGISTGYHSRGGLSSLTINAQSDKLFGSLQKHVPNSVTLNFAQTSITPSISMPTTSRNFAFHAKTGGEGFGFHGNIYVEGYVSTQEIRREDQTQKLPAYGYLYYTDANNNQKALLDYNREKELQFSYKSTPHIAIPQYTYDVYSISGEGTGGTIRPYRGDVGFVRDHFMRTNSEDDQFSAELGFGNTFHLGLAFDFVRSFVENNAWTAQNNLLKYVRFQKSDSAYQSVYFRNPGEKTSNTTSYYQQVGDDDLIRVKLDRSALANVSATNNFLKIKNGKVSGLLPISNNIVKKERDKRGQVVTYLTAKDATMYGLQTKIYSYQENSIPVGICQDQIEAIDRIDGTIRKANHLSEIDVLNADGRRYVYGIPAYNIEQRDVTFSVNKENNTANLDKGLVQYGFGDDTKDNNKGKEAYFNEETIPAYAHSFLLSGILSPDYVDIKEDGITEDDLGDAVKFNYTRVFGPTQAYFEWRTPGDQGMANYNEGLKTYNRDDKANYLYGKKEVWYTHSIESKTMIALFKLSANRKDAFAVASKSGGVNAGKPLRRLDKIELYAKADLVKNGSSAKPIKTVHFEYSYELVPNYIGNSTTAEYVTIKGQQVNINQAKGKLTLKKIWFSYNGNEKGKQNPYAFNYSGKNPGYHSKKYDRWGNYKEASENPGGLNNADYPYVTKDSAVAAQNASAWLLADIRLPSGGRMKVTYESDDYAYVQNKRAQQMFTIAGFGKSPNETASGQLYDGLTEREYVFIESNTSIENANDIFKKYLEGNEWIYMKMAVKMPNDRWGSGYEFVPVYGKVQEFGRVGSTNRFWLKFQKVQGGSPFFRAALQFLKGNLPSKLYPTSELGDNIKPIDAVKMLLSSVGEIVNSVAGLENTSKIKGLCKTVEVNKSFIRLNSPDYRKMGGGLRVKRIEIFDNWNAMTQQKESIYGQEYSYKTSIDINGKKQIISSGVATYEPMIGGEENPFRQPISYSERLVPLTPVSFLYSEMPLGESYFPGASVGYSKVRVRTINAKAKSANGWEETEFYTSKDFPTIVEHSLLDQDAKARYKPKLLNFLKIKTIDRTTVSQGFKIELNDMNGKMKATASYSENDSLNPIAYSLNFYKVDNDRAAQKKLNNTVWMVDSLNGHINKNGSIGKDIEVMTDFRQQFSSTVSGGFDPNVDFFMVGIFPVPLATYFKFPQFAETMFRSAATVKVVHRYGILDSMVVMDKGSVLSTKNLLYDGETGEVLLSRTNNEFNDPIYNFSYPAHWAYSGMGMAYKNIDALFSNLKLVNGKLYYPGTQEFPAEKYFESGDVLWAMGVEEKAMSGESCLLFNPMSGMLGTKVINKKLWAIDAAFGSERDKGIYFIDENGKAVTGSMSSMKVIRSGKRNMLDASVGSIVAMQNPIREISQGQFKLIIDSNTKVVNAAASSYKNIWKVENTLYQKDTSKKAIGHYSEDLFPHEIARARVYSDRVKKRGIHFDHINQVIFNPKTVIASYDFLRKGGSCGDRSMSTKTMLKFDLNKIPQGAIITDAIISFATKRPDHLFDQVKNDCSKPYYSYDWNRADNYFLGDSRVNLKRITANWNGITKYWNFITTRLNQSGINSTTYREVNCRYLLQDAINIPNQYYGFMFEIVKQSRSNIETSETNYLSFCPSSEVTSDLGFCDSNTNFRVAIDPKCNCSDPRLYVSYDALYDSAYKVCRNNISDTATNPYRWGILGNWRMDRAYTYYQDRNESNARSSETDIRKEGLLKNFTPYWKFTDMGLQPNADSLKWVWNSAMAGYNRKGFEVENYDPLGRYNSGLYGYNQTLPVAVVQNSRYREMLFDGFEDYSYKTQNCSTCDLPREFDFVKGQSGTAISDVESHTGKYSIRVSSGSQSRITVPVLNDSLSRPEDLISIKIKRDTIFNIAVSGKGVGLRGSYLGRNCNTNVNITKARIDSVINFNWGIGKPHDSVCLINSGNVVSNPNFYTVGWSGSIQAKYTGYHRFYLEFSGGLGGLSVTRFADPAKGISRRTVSINQRSLSNAKYQTDTIFLKQGEIYTINIQYNKVRNGDIRNTRPAVVKLSWSEQQNMPEVLIPKSYLYSSNPVSTSDTVGSIQKNVKFICVKLDSLKPHKGDLKHVVRSTFSPTQGKMAMISGWARIEGADCSTAAALADIIEARFNASNGSVISIITLQKTGVRIEGWQRYENIVKIPDNATQLAITLKTSNGRNVFFDDVRVQPYNANMKSYVYDPISLRLMAELDENNYAAFYEYDDDGTLIRVKKETEKGIMTIKETRSALIKKEND